jgi:hypothetical protein
MGVARVGAVVVALLALPTTAAGAPAAAGAARRPPVFEVVRLDFSYKSEFSGFSMRYVGGNQEWITSPKNGAGYVSGRKISCGGRRGRRLRLCRAYAPPGRFPLARGKGPCQLMLGEGCIPLLWGNLPERESMEEYFEERQADGSYVPRKCASKMDLQEHFLVELRLERKTVDVVFRIPTPTDSCGRSIWSFDRTPPSSFRIPLRKFLVKPGRKVRIEDKFETALVKPYDDEESIQNRVSGTYRSTRLLELRRVRPSRHR